MAYQIYVTIVNEDTGVSDKWLLRHNVYETKALALYLARNNKDFDGYDILTVEQADNRVYVKQPKSVANSNDPYRYGSAEHQMFGDAWLYADCEGAW
jgi:hypothetical protein